jgi:hypothetical protein
MAQLGRILLVFGVVLLVVGAAIILAEKLGLGRLPGDIRVQTENGVFYFPLMTCIVISAVLSLIFWLFRR